LKAEKEKGRKGGLAYVSWFGIPLTTEKGSLGL
jgi:hypothetical protein